MNQTRAIDRDSQERIIADAVRDQRPLAITFNLPDGWRRCKGAFVSGSRQSGETVVRVRFIQSAPQPPPPSVGATVGGAFRQGHRKCLFNALVRSCRVQGDAMTLTLTWPVHFSQLQRRVFERAEPPRGTVIAVRFWREGSSDAGNGVRDVRHGQLEDISAGGMRIRVAETRALELDHTYKCVFTPLPGKSAFVLDALLRHRQALENARASLGFQFMGLETSPEGLKTLERIARLVGHFQRSHARRRGNARRAAPHAG